MALLALSGTALAALTGAAQAYSGGSFFSSTTSFSYATSTACPMSPTGTSGCTNSVSWNYSSSFIYSAFFNGPTGGYNVGSAGLFSAWWNSASGPNGSSSNGGYQSQYTSWNYFYGQDGTSTLPPAVTGGFTFPSFPSSGSSTPVASAAGNPFASQATTQLAFSPMAKFQDGVSNWYAAVTR